MLFSVPLFLGFGRICRRWRRGHGLFSHDGKIPGGRARIAQSQGAFKMMLRSNIFIEQNWPLSVDRDSQVFLLQACEGLRLFRTAPRISRHRQMLCKLAWRPLLAALWSDQESGHLLLPVVLAHQGFGRKRSGPVYDERVTAPPRLA